MYSGRCHCGYARFQFDGDVLTCYTCHCTRCQSSSGSAFSINMIVQSVTLSLISGDIETLKYQYNDRELQCYQCRHCGTVLWMNYADKSEYASIQAGTFDEQGWYEPVAHLWMLNAQTWLSLSDQTQRYDTQPEFEELITLWQNRSTDAFSS